MNSFFILFLPLLIIFLITNYLPAASSFLTSYKLVYLDLGPYQNVRLIDIFISVAVIDYGFTVIVGLIHKKPQFLFYGLFFFFMHYVTSLILITSVIPGFFSKSVGRWTSPKRSLEQLSVKI